MEFAHDAYTHKEDGRVCILLEDGSWFVPLDVGGEGYSCDREHPGTNSSSYDLMIAEHLLALALTYRKYGWDDISAGTSPRLWETRVETWLRRRKYKAHNETPSTPEKGPIMAQQDKVHDITDLPKERRFNAKKALKIGAITALAAGIVLIAVDAVKHPHPEELRDVETEPAA